MRWTALVAALCLLAACQTTRQARPVAIAQPGDDALACSEIATIQASNRLEAARLAKLDEGVAIGNAFAVTLSRAWFWPAVFGVDLSDAEEIEVRALHDRNRRLEEIARAKGCVVSAESVSGRLTAPA